ncbi:hypothetical protein HJG60_011665 [Phyllostomus discolor]|uniref:Uncharacterized protein n=1 Tax=Phyllostomus discolor TaxID=89673 RepID=A0A834E112_9CHIR|nr:hypothetical protein HJG60_011665 [Phyllostomus discolor]
MPPGIVSRLRFQPAASINSGASDSESPTLCCTVLSFPVFPGVPSGPLSRWSCLVFSPEVLCILAVVVLSSRTPIIFSFTILLFCSCVIFNCHFKVFLCCSVDTKWAYLTVSIFSLIINGSCILMLSHVSCMCVYTHIIFKKCFTWHCVYRKHVISPRLEPLPRD